MKLAIVRTHMQMGGVEVNLLHLAIECKLSGMDVDVYVWNHDTNNMSKELDKYEVPIRVGLPQDFNEYDAIICWGPMLYKLQLLTYTKKLFCIIGNKGPGYYSAAIDRLFNIAGCICDSQDTADYVRSINPDIPCYKWFYMKPPALLDMMSRRGNLGLNDDQIVFGTMCNLGEKKRVDRIISAYAKALSLGMTNTFLAIGGDGPTQHKLEAQAIALLPPSSFKFTGRMPLYETGAFLNSLDCFLTSHAPAQGGICMSASESTGAGCFLIIGDVAGIKENILAPEFGIVIPDDALEDRMPQEMLAFSKRDRTTLFPLKAQIKDAYKHLYEQHKGIIPWLTK